MYSTINVHSLLFHFRSPAPKRIRTSEAGPNSNNNNNNSVWLHSSTFAMDNHKPNPSNIMAPVLKVTERSFWLANDSQKIMMKQEEAVYRAPVNERGKVKKKPNY